MNRPMLAAGRLLLAACCLLLAACSSEPEPSPRLELRRIAPGMEAMPGIVCVSVELGAPARVVLRNEGARDRRIAWLARWRTIEGTPIRTGAERVREVILPARGQGTILAEPPSAEARQIELLMGDPP
jgi:uncharacterized protein YcfL